MTTKNQNPNNNNNPWLSRTECAALRGVAILAIILHNFCHWLRLAVKENEYTFNASKADRFLHELASPDLYFPIQFVSFLGHYGVPLFLFLSGFGLVMKYGRQETLSPYRFVRFHYLKLLGMMVTGYVAFTMMDAITPGSFHFKTENIVAQLLMYINVLPHPNNIIWPGPYWFFGLMMQLYIVYILLLHRRHWLYIVALIVLCWGLQAVNSPESDTLNRLRYNCIGGMLPFGCGLLTARLTQAGILDSLNAWKRWHWALLALAALTGIITGSAWYATWYWVPLAVVIGGVALVKALPLHRMNWMVWTGEISAALFVAHPILRKIFIPLSHRGDVYAGILLYLLASLCVAWLFHLIINKIPKPRL